jgi:hypothetical protein
MNNIQVDNAWSILNRINVVSIVYASPRPGTDFLHSLFDSHPQILTFDGWLIFHEFYNKSISIYGTDKFINGIDGASLIRRKREVIATDFFREFAWKHLHKFDTSYDSLEKKDRLGVDGNEFNIVDIDKFVELGVKLMNNKDPSSKNFFLATYCAYALARGEDLNLKKVLLHHIHDQNYLPDVVRDFSDLKVIACIRDPRVVVTKINTYIDNGTLSRSVFGGVISYYKSMLGGVMVMPNIKKDHIRVNVLERLHRDPEGVMRSICSWIEIDYSRILLNSTWNGKLWHGDSLSTGINHTFSVERYDKDVKQWNKDLSVVDKIVINNVMIRELKHYNHGAKYKYHIFFAPLVIIFILLPTSYEVKLLFNIVKEGKYRLTLELIKLYLRRCFFTFIKYNHTLFNKVNLFKYF